MDTQKGKPDGRLLSPSEIVLAGKNCTRITIPILSIDHIEKAAEALRELAEDLEAVAKDETHPTYVRVMVSRSLINRVSKYLKGGIAYKGAR